MHRFLCKPSTLLTGLLCLSGALGAPAQEPQPEAGVETLRRGQTGYGLSVFEGTEPVRFDVEVLGVVRNSRPGESYVLARLSGQGLEETGVVAGMSGSPVYIDDRLIGAVAFAWPFTNGAVGGITPIESMRRLSDAGPLPEVTAADGSRIDLLDLRLTETDSTVLLEEIGRLSPELPGQARNGLLWSLAGFGDLGRGLLEQSLAAVAPAGKAESSAGGLEAGSAVAGVLVDGDLRLAVTGTVTDRTGDEILAFGHAFLGQGPLRLPMATADVITVLSNQMVSFKIANVGEVVGSFDLDLVSGVRGRVGADVETIPLSIAVEGMGAKRFEMQLADVPVYLPTLVAIATLGTFEAASHSGGAQGIDVEVRWELESHGQLAVSQSFDGSSAALSAATYLFLFTNFLANNPLEETRLQSVSIDLTQHPQPRTGRILGGFADRSIVHPGDVVTVALEIQPFRGEVYQQRLRVVLPRDLHEGRYSLIVGDGVTVDAVRQMVEQVEPQTLSQVLERVRGFHSNRDLVALGLVSAPGLTFSGEVLPQLPGSIRQLWGSAVPAGSARPLGLAVVQELTVPSETPLAGGVRIDLEVERASPTSMAPTPPAAQSGRWANRAGRSETVVRAAATAAELLHPESNLEDWK